METPDFIPHTFWHPVDQSVVHSVVSNAKGDQRRRRTAFKYPDRRTGSTRLMQQPGSDASVFVDVEKRKMDILNTNCLRDNPAKFYQFLSIFLNAI